MRLLTVAMLGASPLLLGQTDTLKQGEDIFLKSCGTGYCHGTRGVGGGAPRLAARGFDQAYITNTVSRGVPGTSMAAFSTSLSRSELSAVIAYVAGLNGITNATVTPARSGPAPAFSALASRGRELFSDAVRGFGRCSTCHEVNGIGISVATPIQSVPQDAQAFRGLVMASVKTAILNNQSMPALPVSNGSRGVIFYDLTSVPPVVHTAESGSVTWKDGGDWRHSLVIGSYSDSDIIAVLAYLREVVKP